MTGQPAGYVLCGTPRSGSTLLCRLLADSGAGQPHSYFREADIAYWAELWGVSTAAGIETAQFDRDYLSAMHRIGTADTGLFGLRLMWPSLADAERRLNRAVGSAGEVVERLETAFGSLLFIHMSRQDKLAQAISLLKAQQSGLWHLAGDGSVLEGPEHPAAIAYDRDVITTTIAELEHEDAAWEAFFAARRMQPHRITYESLTAAPRETAAGILSRLGRDPAITTRLSIPTAKMADAVSQQWADRYRAG